jgi:hypothetical protein
MAYTKLFNSIVTSTIWSEDDQTRIVWITMLALADKNGEVQGSVPGLARIAGVTVDACRAAISKFLAPDPDSRTKDDEGRRIEEIDGGWALINHRKYRDMASDADRAEKAAIRQARHRANQTRNGVTPLSRTVTHSNAPVTPESHQIPHADTDTDTDTDTDSKADSDAEKRKKKPKPVQSPAALDGFATFWQAYPKKQGKEPARKAWMRDKPDIQKVLSALEWQKLEDQWTKDEGQFIPLPATYLNAKRYEDESPSVSDTQPDYVYLDKMTPEERMTHFRRNYHECDWPYILEDGSIDMMAQMFRNRERKEAERRAAEGPSPETTEGNPELW